MVVTKLKRHKILSMKQVMVLKRWKNRLRSKKLLWVVAISLVKWEAVAVTTPRATLTIATQNSRHTSLFQKQLFCLQ